MKIAFFTLFIMIIGFVAIAGSNKTTQGEGGQYCEKNVLGFSYISDNCAE